MSHLETANKKQKGIYIMLAEMTSKLNTIIFDCFTQTIHKFDATLILGSDFDPQDHEPNMQGKPYGKPNIIWYSSSR